MADSSLFLQDFRANERTYQLLTQTLGRAGRGKKAGKVIIQTYSPEHPVLQYIKSGQQEEFYEEELATREMLGYPPFNHIFSILLAGSDESMVIDKIHILQQYLKYYNRKKLFRIIGPVQATIGKIAGEYRWKIIIVGKQRDILLLYGRYCIDKFNVQEYIKQIRIEWDIDPISMI